MHDRDTELVNPMQHWTVDIVNGSRLRQATWMMVCQID